MTSKERIYNELEINPKISYEEILKRGIKCKEKTFLNNRTNWRKSKKGFKKGKGKKKGKLSSSIITPQGKGTKTPLSIQQFQELSWKEKIEASIFGMLPLDIQALSLYERLGYLKEDEQEEEGRKFIFKEPDWFVPHQSDMYNAFIKGNCCIIGMRQLTYKTTTALIATANLLWTHDGSLIVEISTGMDLSKELIGKVETDKRVYPIWEPISRSLNRESKVLMNKSRLICRPCKPSSLQGLTGGLWIDELDKIIVQKETRQALAAALPIVITLLMEGSAFIWITCNQASDEGVLQFEYFLRVLAEFGNYFPIYRIQDNPKTKEFELIQINNFDIEIPTDPIAKRDFFRDMLFKLLSSLHDEAFAKAQMLNIYDDTAGMFRAELVADAFEYWSENNLPHPAYNSVMAIDPGHTHATAVIVLQKDRNGSLHEVFAKEYFGKTISEEEFKDEIFRLYREYGVREVYVESNSGGKWWRDHWVERGMNCHLSNFGTANPNTGDVTNMGKAFERAWYERVLKDFLEKHKIFLHNEDLLKEFSLYNPVDNKEKGKGDLVDALLHCCFYAAGGISYLMSLIEEKESIYSEEGGAILL